MNSAFKNINFWSNPPKNTLKPVNLQTVTLTRDTGLEDSQVATFDILFSRTAAYFISCLKRKKKNNNITGIIIYE